MNNTIFVAVNKETRKIIPGAKGQYAFDNEASLGRSLGQTLGWIAGKEGKKPKDLYDIMKFDLFTGMTEEIPEQEPFKVHEVYGSDWNDQGRLELQVNGRNAFSIGCLSECPEDASLERDLNFVYRISDLLEEAWKAGKEGRPFEYSSENEEEEE